MRRRQFFVTCLLLVGNATSVFADSVTTSFGGNLKSNVLLQKFPHDSVLHEESGSNSADATANLRLTAKAHRGPWAFNADYQLIAAYSDSQNNLLSSSTFSAGQGSLPDDQRRWFDLTQGFSTSGRTQSLQRLDRLWIGYTTQDTVVRFGRQALSWGNGLFYSPMDIVNPFDPAAIDTEYKVGDDMLYVQRLLPSGNDVEAAWVVRRDPLDGDIASGEATTAVRYSAFNDGNEYQLLLARSYDDTVIGAGGSRSVGGAVWRADLVLSDADRWRAQLVVNASYSWMWHKKNVTGSLEYYFNGFGITGRGYEIADITSRPQLAARLARGETYSVGRQYLAGGLSIEVSPLLLISPTLFANLADRSALLQLSSQYSLGDNLTLLGALTLPIGPQGSEFRGIRNATGNNYLSRDAALFAQLAWYF